MNKEIQTLENHIKAYKKIDSYLADITDASIALVQRMLLLLLAKSKMTKPVYLTICQNEFPDIALQQLYTAFKCVNKEATTQSPFYFSMVAGTRDKTGKISEFDNENPSLLCCLSTKHFTRDEEKVAEILVTKEILDSISLEN